MEKPTYSIADINFHPFVDYIGNKHSVNRFVSIVYGYDLSRLYSHCEKEKGNQPENILYFTGSASL